MKVLAIDNRRNNRNTNANHTSRTFEDGVNKLKTEKWDLLYLDYDLGKYKKSGYDVMQFVKENKEFAPKMIMSISPEPSCEDRINGMIKDVYGRVFDSRDVESLKESETKPERI